jgi:hypothetical protein
MKFQPCMQSDLDAIETWTKNNNMKFNGIKCKEMIMDHLHYRLNFDLDKNFITA